MHSIFLKELKQHQGLRILQNKKVTKEEKEKGREEETFSKPKIYKNVWCLWSQRGDGAFFLPN